MTQSTILFAGDIRDNLRVAKLDATDEEIYDALKKASIYDHVAKLEHGSYSLCFHIKNLYLRPLYSLH